MKMKITKNYCCMDCGNLISKPTALKGKGRCRHCSKLGILNYQYKHGQNICPICSKPISFYANKCQRCAKTGQLNSNYKNGKPKCIDCGKFLACHKKTVKRCHFCYVKFARGKNSPTFGKTTHGRFGRYKNIFMRSSWELNFAKWCDLSGIKWKYEYKTFDLGSTTYTPDFYLPEFDCYIEIKGYWRDDAKKKFKFVQKYFNIDLDVFDEKILKMLGII